MCENNNEECSVCNPSLISELSRVMRRLFEGVKEKLLHRICTGELTISRNVSVCKSRV